jgi:uncharacterized protein (DUF486 family)
MTYAWYGHLKNMSNKAWYAAAIVSWLIAFFEYMVQVPANRLGYTVYTLPQLKIIQEVISLSVFIPFDMIVMNQPFKTNYIWACLCLVGVVYFMFKN